MTKTTSEKIRELLEKGERIFLKKNDKTIAMIDNKILQNKEYYFIGDTSIYTMGLTIIFDNYEVC